MFSYVNSDFVLRRFMTHMLLCVLLIAPGIVPFQALAQQVDLLPFHPEYIISDEQMQELTMSANEVQVFLEYRGSYLANFVDIDDNGIVRTAAEIIDHASREYLISQRVLIVMLQKEQSLIEQDSPSDRSIQWATGYALCDQCSASHPNIVAYRGFTNQVYSTARRLRSYFENPNAFDVQVGKPIHIDGQVIVPENQATANLYIYTPHILGNLNFYQLWTRYFGKSYPDGTLLHDVDTDRVWLIQNGARRAFFSTPVLRHMLFTKGQHVVDVRSVDLASHQEGPPIRYLNYSLLQSPAGASYLVADAIKYLMPSAQVLHELGFNFEEIMHPKASDRELYDEGVSPSAQALLQQTPILVRNSDTGAIFAFTNNTLAPIANREIMNLRFPNKPAPWDMTTKALQQYQRVSPLTLDDGMLITSSGDPSVYVIEQGKRRPFASREVFLQFGYHPEAIRFVSPETLSIHPLGHTLNLPLLQNSASLELSMRSMRSL